MSLPVWTRNSLGFFEGFFQNFHGHADLPLSDVKGREERRLKKEMDSQVFQGNSFHSARDFNR